MLVLKTAELDRIEAAGNYLRVHVGEEVHLVRSTLKAMEERLDGRGFLRIHRSTVVNAEHIRELRPTEDGELVVVLRDGTQLRAGRQYKAGLEAFLG